MIVLGVVLSVLLTLVLLLWVRKVVARAEDRRDAELGAAAAALGFEPDPGGEEDLAREVKAFETFDHGSDGNVRRLHRARTAGLDVALFDYETMAGDELVRWSALRLQSPAFDLPAFQVRRKGWGGRIAALLGGEIPFPNRPSFSKRYRVTGDDEVAIRRLFHDGVLDRLEREEPLELESAGDALLIHRDRITPAELPALVRGGVEVARLLGVAAARR
ncbi:MAG: hypothetical protein AB7R55_16365 [Gemmatimonadales bacterium]